MYVARHHHKDDTENYFCIHHFPARSIALIFYGQKTERTDTGKQGHCSWLGKVRTVCTQSQRYDNYILKSPPSVAPEEAAMFYFTPC